MRKNILLIIPNFGTGGAQASFSKLSLLLSTHHQVYNVVFSDEYPCVYPLGGELIDLGTPANHTALKKANAFYTRYRKLKRLKKSLGIDVSVSFLEGANYLNVLSKQQDEVYISVRGSTIHDGAISGWQGIFRKQLLIPLLYKKADKVVAVAEALRQEMIDDFGVLSDKVVTIPNFYDIPNIHLKASQALNETEKLLFDRPVLVNSGRFHIQKEQQKLISIFKQVRDKLPSRLLLLGIGSLKERLISHAKSLGLQVVEWTGENAAVGEADIILMGYQENPFKFIRHADLFVFPSSWEGFPNALIEALICGTLAISADCPTGPREIMAPDTPVHQYAESPEKTYYGWLMPLLKKNDKEVLTLWSKVIIQCLTDNTQEKRDTILVDIGIYSKEKVSKKWLQLIEE